MNVKNFALACVLGLGTLLTTTLAATPVAPAGRAVPAPDRLRAACMAADFNHDGFVSLDEFHRDVLQSWRALHLDGSGYVSLAELSSIPGVRRGMLERLTRADTDGDGKLAFKEVVVARMTYFEGGDADNDDRLSMQECMDHQRRMDGTGGKARK